jgi:hypothetical protein
MLSLEENQRLTRVGPGTPMGTLLRSLNSFLTLGCDAGFMQTFNAPQAR